MPHKDRRLQRERKEEARKPRLSRGTCALCKEVNPKSVKCPESENGHITLGEE